MRRCRDASSSRSKSILRRRGLGEGRVARNRSSANLGTQRHGSQRPISGPRYERAPIALSGAVSLAWARLNEPLSPVAAREVARVKSLRIRLLLAAEAAHGQIFEKIDRGHRAEAVAAASGQSPTGPSSPWPALMTLNGAARTYAGFSCSQQVGCPYGSRMRW